MACDLLQDIFVKLCRKGDRFENEMQLKTYLVPGCPESLPDLCSGYPKKEKTYGGFRGGRDRESFVHQMIEPRYTLINDISRNSDACRMFT